MKVDQKLMLSILTCIPDREDKMLVARDIIRGNFYFRPYVHPSLPDDPHGISLAWQAWNRWTTEREKRSYIFFFDNRSVLVDPPKDVRTCLGRIWCGLDQLWLEQPS